MIPASHTQWIINDFVIYTQLSSMYLITQPPDYLCCASFPGTDGTRSWILLIETNNQFIPQGQYYCCPFKPTRWISWLQIPWHLTSPGHQQQWYWTLTWEGFKQELSEVILGLLQCMGSIKAKSHLRSVWGQMHITLIYQNLFFWNITPHTHDCHQTVQPGTTPAYNNLTDVLQSAGK